MKEPIDISFKPIHEGVGFSSEPPRSFSYYEKNEEDLASKDVFNDLVDSPKFYDQLLERLENPILESVHPSENLQHKDRLQKPSDIPPKKNMDSISKENSEWSYADESPLNSLFLLPWSVLRLDMMFTLGIYLLGGILSVVAFGIQQIPSLFFIILSYGVFHQIYLILCRSLMGCSLGEERYNIRWNTKSVFHFLLRGFFCILTGFVFLPLSSMILRKDILSDCTDLRPQYNI